MSAAPASGLHSQGRCLTSIISILEREHEGGFGHSSPSRKTATVPPDANSEPCVAEATRVIGCYTKFTSIALEGAGLGANVARQGLVGHLASVRSRASVFRQGLEAGRDRGGELKSRPANVR